MQLEHNLNQRHVKLVCLQNNLWDQKMKKPFINIMKK